MEPNGRALTLGLVLMITLAGFEASAIATVMPDVNRELHGIGLYGWVARSGRRGCRASSRRRHESAKARPCNEPLTSSH